MEWSIHEPARKATISGNFRRFQVREGDARMTPSLHVHPAFRFDLEPIIPKPVVLATILSNPDRTGGVFRMVAIPAGCAIVHPSNQRTEQKCPRSPKPLSKPSSARIPVLSSRLDHHSIRWWTV